MSTTTSEPRVLGKPITRVDGRLKVMGAARYAAEFGPKDVRYVWLLKSTISKGRITSLDIAKAESAVGVRAVLTHENVAKLKEPEAHPEAGGGIRSEERLPLSDAEIHYGGQYIAAVVADTLEQARYGSSLIKAIYEESAPALTHEDANGTGKKPKQNNGAPVQLAKGNVGEAFADAALISIEETYTTPTETHNPMEPSATVAEWTGDDALTVHDATQFVKGVQDLLARTFNLEPAKVRVISPFVGGAFGCKGALWPHVVLAVMAAKKVGAPVKLALTRQDMFTGTGHRTPTTQKIKLAAKKDGTLQAMRHVVQTVTSPVGEFVESVGSRTTGVMYASPAIAVEETVYEVNVATPTFMRAPGECPGSFGLECAMDELAFALKMDPLKLRLTNYADANPISGKPFSTKFLEDAYRFGAEKFGWDKWTPERPPLSPDGLLVGWGMATATYPGYKMMADAKIKLSADGSVVVQCAAHELGTGAYTALSQISAEAIGVPMEAVTFELGDSKLPFGPVAGGSNTTGTVGSAIYDAAKDLHMKLAKLAAEQSDSPLHGLDAQNIVLSGVGKLAVNADPSRSDTFAGILQRAGQSSIEGNGGFKPGKDEPPVEFQSFGAQFCEVMIDPAKPRVQVTRFVSVVDCGRVINAKTAHSQILGGVVMGIGMALEEETVYDRATGLPATRNLAEYHVPVNADIQNIDVHFVGEPDLAFNPMGARGMGEIGITGVAAAIANAVFHATGKRVRDLPITLDKLL